MSNYITEAKLDRDKPFEEVLMMDDYFGSHKYGVRFLDGSIHKAEDCIFKLDKN